MEKKKLNKKKKRVLITLSISLLILIGVLITLFTIKDSKTQNTLKPVNNNTSSDNENRVFSKDDQTKATLLTQQLIDILSQYDGKSFDPAYPEQQQVPKVIYDKIQQQLNLVYKDSSITISTLMKFQSKDNKLRFSRNLFVIGMPLEIYYKTLNVHELIIPITYKNRDGRNLNYELYFVKTINGELKVIDGLVAVGKDFKKLEEEANIDSVYRQRYIDETKELRIK